MELGLRVGELRDGRQGGGVDWRVFRLLAESSPRVSISAAREFFAATARSPRAAAAKQRPLLLQRLHFSSSESEPQSPAQEERERERCESRKTRRCVSSSVLVRSGLVCADLESYFVSPIARSRRSRTLQVACSELRSSKCVGRTSPWTKAKGASAGSPQELHAALNTRAKPLANVTLNALRPRAISSHTLSRAASRASERDGKAERPPHSPPPPP